jgi:NADH-quinone oxidoreductase subunit D
MSVPEHKLPRRPYLRLEEMVLNVGPQHPATHGVLRLVLHLNGEMIVKADPVLGYLHRGFEKLAENRTYYQFLAMMSRLDYLANIFMEWPLVRCLEGLMRIKVPRRAEYLRIMVAELNRIASHQMAIGDFLLNLGAGTPIFWAFRDREVIIDLLEMLCGQRMMYNYMRVGGVRYDIPPGFEAACRKFIAEFPARIDEYEKLITDNEIFLARTLGVGIIDAAEAIDYGLTGPNLRASGVSWDLRKDDAYSAYNDFEFDIPIGKHGDCFDRYKCRIEEMRQSLKIVEQALDGLPEGPVSAGIPPMLRPRAGEKYRAVESPRGEWGLFLVSNGGLRPYRLKMRDPNFVAISTLPRILPGYKIADVIAIAGSMDFMLGGADR